ncbi:hypothetical protein T4C_6283 [Trichinella pseudospiralis]|uniref:Uncharacterized protein n=1 Tax=Trichinella pseudospiralis TaxID=6337 RepID=A0A0V1ISA2_TRIPS|nr:hypothetical protein T4C_6283 [Trichinella pseudospiralis]
MDDVTSALSLYPVHSNTTEKDFNSLGEKPHWQHSVILKWIEETRQLSGKKRANLMARKQSVHCIMLMEFIWRKRRRSEADPATCSVGLLLCMWCCKSRIRSRKRTRMIGRKALVEGSFGHIRAPWLKGFRSVGTNRRGPGKMLETTALLEKRSAKSREPYRAERHKTVYDLLERTRSAHQQIATAWLNESVQSCWIDNRNEPEKMGGNLKESVKSRGQYRAGGGTKLFAIYWSEHFTGAVKWGQGWQGERGPCHSIVCGSIRHKPRKKWRNCCVENSRLSCWSGKVESTVSYKNSALFLWEKGTSYLNTLTVVNMGTYSTVRERIGVNDVGKRWIRGQSPTGAYWEINVNQITAVHYSWIHSLARIKYVYLYFLIRAIWGKQQKGLEAEGMKSIRLNRTCVELLGENSCWQGKTPEDILGKT